MEREKIIIYGLGDNYRKYIDDIAKKYFINGISDRQNREEKNYIRPEDLLARPEKIVVTCGDARGVSYDLVVNRNITPDRIILWKNEIFRKKIAKQEILTFSQFCEDMIFASILRDKNIALSSVKYIEVGVEDPIQSSNTYLFHVHGGSGILVDANPECIPYIKVVRKNQTVLNSAVYDKKGKMKFYISDNAWRSSLDREIITKSGYEVAREVLVDTISINELLSMQPDTNVLSIDIEGYDEKVLYDIDFKTFHPDVICAEVGRPDNKLINYMKKNGYNGVINNMINTIWF